MSAVPAIPPGFSALTPHLVCRGAADAIAFYARAFGAVEACRLPTPDGRLMHAMLTIDGAPLMLVDEFPERGCLGPQGSKSSHAHAALRACTVPSGQPRQRKGSGTPKREPHAREWEECAGRTEFRPRAPPEGDKCARRGQEVHLERGACWRKNDSCGMN